MRVAILVRRLNVRGGTQQLAAQFALELKARGHEVTFYTFFYAKEECYPELLNAFTVIEADPAYVDAMRRTGPQRGPLAFVRNVLNENRAAANLASKIDPSTDVLNPHDQLVYRVVRYFKRGVRRVPAVWTVNDISTKRASLRRNVLFDSTLRLSLLRRVWYWCIDYLDYRLFVRYQDAITVLDRRNQSLAQKEFPGIPVTIVRGGLAIREFTLTPHAAHPEVRLLLFAILLPHRRFEDGIAALPLLKEKGITATLSIVGGVGDGRYHRKLLSLVELLGVQDQVQFKGKVSPEELRRAFRESDIFIFPAHMQTWGLAIFEAMATGLPVIVSETTGASEVLEQRTTALIVPPCNPKALAGAVEALVQDPQLYQTLSANGRTFVEREISWTRFADAMLDVFAEAARKYRL